MCMSFNVRSVCNKVEDFIKLMEVNNVDVAFVSETWLQSNSNPVTAEIKSFGYRLHHCHRVHETKDRGGGVAIVCKTIFELFPCTKNSDYVSFEHVIGRLYNSINKTNFIMITVYRNQNIPESVFISDFHDMLEYV